MVTTLGEMMDTVQAELGRGSDTQVRNAIIAAITEHEREMHSFAERRFALVELQTGQTWHSQIGFRSPSLFTAAQITEIQDIPAEDAEWSFDDMPWVGEVSDIIKIQYARLWADGDGSQTWKMDVWPYKDFERLREGTETASQPHVVSLHSYQVGVFPKPDQQYPLWLSCWCKPFKPLADGTQDTSTSVFFNEAEELIRNAAKRRLCVMFRDPDGRDMYRSEEMDALSRLRSENATRSYGRIRPHGPC